MRLNNYQDRSELFVNWIIETLPERAEVLDIGASDGTFSPQVELLRSAGVVIDGVDPDGEAMERNPHIRHRYVGRLEDAPLPAGAFDAAFAIYVAEHVENPERFLPAAHRVLKPGGSLFLITPNGAHYFAAISRLLQHARLQERVLRMIRPGTLVDRYHHEAFYRMNRPSTIERLARDFGFEGAELRFCEKLEEFSPYFPGPTKLIPWIWQQLARLTARERMLGNLMARLRKPWTVSGFAYGTRPGAQGQPTSNGLISPSWL